MIPPFSYAFSTLLLLAPGPILCLFSRASSINVSPLLKTPQSSCTAPHTNLDSLQWSSRLCMIGRHSPSRLCWRLTHTPSSHSSQPSPLPTVGQGPLLLPTWLQSPHHPAPCLDDTILHQGLLILCVQLLYCIHFNSIIFIPVYSSFSSKTSLDYHLHAHLHSTP